MTDSKNNEYDDVLDEATLCLLGDAPSVVNADPNRMQNMRAQLMRRVDNCIANSAESFFTVRDHSGDWVVDTQKVARKFLRQDPETGTASYLVRMAPGAEVGAHRHEFDEHCFVLKGELIFEDLHLLAGDYHFAAAGSLHSVVRTTLDTLVYIQTASPGPHASL